MHLEGMHGVPLKAGACAKPLASQHACTRHQAIDMVVTNGRDEGAGKDQTWNTWRFPTYYSLPCVDATG